MIRHRATRLIAMALCVLSGSVDDACATRQDEFKSAMTLARDGDLQADWTKLMDARERFAAFTSDEELSALAYYYLGYSDWRLSSLLFMGVGPRAQGKLLERAVGSLEIAIQKRPDFPDAHALLASCLAIWVSADPSLQEKLVPRIRAAWQGVPADVKNPRVMLLRSISLALAPPPYGNREKGLALWRESIERFKTDRPDPLMPNWGDAEAVAWLGGFHLMNDQHKEAIELLERAVQMRPDFWWASKVALPIARRPIVSK